MGRWRVRVRWYLLLETNDSRLADRGFPTQRSEKNARRAREGGDVEQEMEEGCLLCLLITDEGVMGFPENKLVFCALMMVGMVVMATATFDYPQNWLLATCLYIPVV